jgi:hypothetical protein
MSDAKEKGVLTPSNSQLAQEAMLEQMKSDNPYANSAITVQPGESGEHLEEAAKRYATEDTDTSGYIGVSPEYMTYANDTEAPLTAEEGAEAELLEIQQGNYTTESDNSGAPEKKDEVTEEPAPAPVSTPAVSATASATDRDSATPAPPKPGQ